MNNELKVNNHMLSPLKTLETTESMSFAGASKDVPNDVSVLDFFVKTSNKSTVAVNVFSSNSRIRLGCMCSLLFLPPNFKNMVFILPLACTVEQSKQASNASKETSRTRTLPN